MKLNDELLELIKRQFMVLAMNDENYKHLKLYISNEQQFVKEKSREKDAIYIVVKFLAGSLNFGQQLIPVQFNVIAEKNKIESCQNLLLDYVATYNLTMSDSDSIKQFYATPSVTQSFNDIFDGYRSLFFFTGSFLISKNDLSCTIKYKGNSLDVISNSLNFSVNLDSQVFYNTQNFTKSIGLNGTLVLTIASYFVKSDLCLDALKIISKELGVNNSFIFDLEFKNGISMKNIEFKLVNFATQENIGEIPVASMTFTN